MKIEIVRKEKNKKWTRGILYINGHKFCDTLEHQDLMLDSSMGKEEFDEKVKEAKFFILDSPKFCIPTGTYGIDVDYCSKFRFEYPTLRAEHIDHEVHIAHYPRIMENDIHVGFRNPKWEDVMDGDYTIVQSLIRLIRGAKGRGEIVELEIRREYEE